MQVRFERQRRSTAKAGLSTNCTLKPLAVLFKDRNERKLVIDVTKCCSKGHHGTIETAIGSHVGDAHPVETFIVDALQLFGNDLSQEFIETRTSL